MSNYMEIKLSRCMLLLTERELTEALPQELVDTGRRRAKGQKRTRDLAKRSGVKVEEWLENRYRRTSP